jgi:mono/diheme cytochrome c family protein
MRASLIIAGIFLAAWPAGADDLAAGKKLYTAKCAKCHKLHSPAAYDEKTWEMWMTKMRDKAKLNNDQSRQLAAYLQTLRTTTK